MLDIKQKLKSKPKSLPVEKISKEKKLLKAVIFIAIIIIVIIAGFLVLKYSGWFDSIALSYTEKGNEFYEKKMYSKAIYNYDYAIALKELDGISAYEAMLMKSEIYLSKNKTEEARQILTDATKFKSKKVEAYLKLGEILLSEKNYTEAKKVFEKALKAEENNPTALVGEARSMMGLDFSTQEIKSKLSAAQGSDNNLQLPKYYLGLIHLRLGENLESAKERLKEASLLNGPKKEQAKSAYELIDKMAKPNSDDSKEVRAHRSVQIAWLYIELEEWALAKAEAYSAMESVENYRDAYLVTAYAEYIQNNFDKSLELVSKAKELDTVYGFTFYLEAKNLHKKGDYQGAKNSLSKAIAFYYDSADLRLEMAEVMQELDDKELEIADNLEVGLKLSKYDPAIAEKLIWILGEIEDFDRIQKVANYVYESNPKSAYVLAIRALANLVSAKYEEAEANATESIGLNNSEALAHYVLGSVYKINGDTNKAKNEFDLAVEYDTTGILQEKISK